jgi:hypothetical protein
MLYSAMEGVPLSLKFTPTTQKATIQIKAAYT